MTSDHPDPLPQPDPDAQRALDEEQEWGGGSRTIKLIAGGLAIAFLAFVVLLATRDTATNGPNFDIVGDAAPLVEGVSYTGETYTLETALQNNRSLPPSEQTWTVVNFFASWCTGCIEEHPDLTAFSSRTGPCRTELVGVAINDRQSDVQGFFDRLGGSWPVIVGEGTTEAIIGYGVTAPPETVIIAPNGVVVEKWIGAVDYDDLEAVFERLDC